jgi:AcrR family transcriptional regulator
VNSAATRDGQATRGRLLRAAFREFHHFGYRGADLRRILDAAGLTKGALYYHFRSKKDLAYAVIEEDVKAWIAQRWLQPLAGSSDPLESIAELARWGERSATAAGMSLGCPLNRLSQELSGTDEGFRQRLAAIFQTWRSEVEALLAAAQERGVIRADADVAAAATFIVAAWEGSIGLAQALPSPSILGQCRSGLEAYLESLRSTNSRAPSAAGGS